MKVCHTCRQDKEDAFFAPSTSHCRRCVLMGTRKAALERLNLLGASDWTLEQEVTGRRTFVHGRLIAPCSGCCAADAERYVRHRKWRGGPGVHVLGDHWTMCEQLVTKRFLQLYLSQLAHLCTKCAAKPVPPRPPTRTTIEELKHCRDMLQMWKWKRRGKDADDVVCRKAVYFFALRIRSLLDDGERAQAKALGVAPLQEAQECWFDVTMPIPPFDAPELAE